jgi:GT2 family glycosyltransferase
MSPVIVSGSSTVLSIVSHGQLHLIRNFFADLKEYPVNNCIIILTINIPEEESCLRDFPELPITILRNSAPRGFGENHNQAFRSISSEFFVVVNPDIRLRGFSMTNLLESFKQADVGAAAPVVLAPVGTVEDSVRRFPTLLRLFARVVLRRREPDYQWIDALIDVEWFAGMFVAFRSEAFRQVKGFDTRYFMYLEDADICRRLKRAGWRSVLQPAVSVVHDAQRASRRNFKHLRWHLISMFRFLFLPTRNP